MTIHKPVLLKETIDNLNLKKGDIVVDATLGGGGHGREILKAIGESGMLIAFDLSRLSKVSRNFQFSIFNFQTIFLAMPDLAKRDKFQFTNFKTKSW